MKQMEIVIDEKSYFLREKRFEILAKAEMLQHFAEIFLECVYVIYALNAFVLPFDVFFF